MKWNDKFSAYLTKLLKEEWNKNHLAQWTVDERELTHHVHEILLAELNKEKQLEQETQKMLDDLEKTHAGTFERYKMYPILKKKLAEKKGIIL